MQAQPFFSCQVVDCATEVSYPADQLRVYEGEPICVDCYADRRKGDPEYDVVEDVDPVFNDLPAFVPEYVAEIEKLRTALGAIVHGSSLLGHVTTKYDKAVATARGALE
tara:strand:+ start:61 stop:387 length:327 start_codon:yes stop_codon:yes gene_type:complete